MAENDHDHFALSATFAVLMESALKHDKQAIKLASGLIDMTPTVLLRGLAYMASLVDCADDDLPRQHQLAKSTISELTALVAVLIELDCYAWTIRMMEKNELGEV